MGRGERWCGSRNDDREVGGEGTGGPRTGKEGGGRRTGSERGLTAEDGDEGGIIGRKRVSGKHTVDGGIN